MISAVEVARWNNLLGQELGRRPDGHPIFAWKNSDDLFWPAFATGRAILKRVEIPLLRPVDVDCPDCLGTGYERDYEMEDEPEVSCKTCLGAKKITKTSDIAETSIPEYRRDRQMRELNTWVVSKWLSAEDLIFGTDRPHGGRGERGVDSRPDPQESLLRQMWEARYPGAEYPAKGWRIPTNATLPGRADGPREPNEEDTRWFIACVKEQTRLGFDERLKELLAGEDAIEGDKRRVIEDAIRDSFPAFLNPTPGKRSNFVSFPWTKRDLMK